MVRGGVAHERVDGREPGVARRRAVAALSLQVVEKREDDVGGEVVDVQRDNGALAPLREKSEEDEERVAVAANRVGTHAANPGQVGTCQRV